MGSAGEGSRGGKVIRHTASGRAVYAADATAKAAAGHDPHPGARDFSHQGIAAAPTGSAARAGIVDRAKALGRIGNEHTPEHIMAPIRAAREKVEGSLRAHDASPTFDPAAHRARLVEQSKALGRALGNEHTPEAIAAPIRHAREQVETEIRAHDAAHGEPKLRLHGNLDRPAVFNKPGYRGR